MSLDQPRLREVLQPHLMKNEDGRDVVVLVDPTGLVDTQVAFPPQLLPLFLLFNGRNTLQDVRDRWQAEFGETVRIEVLQSIVERLDENHFLVSDRFDRYVEGLKDAYEAAPLRVSRMAGMAYPDDPARLGEMLHGFFEDSGRGCPAVGSSERRLRGLIAPHIDLEAGAACYAAAYKALAESPAPPLFVILGTDHFGWHRFTATRKGFATPFGPIETDQDFLARLQDRFDESLLEDEFKHAWEHSIEFQTLWLRYLYPDAPIRMVPIMCGSFADAVFAGRRPSELPDVEALCTALRETIEEWPEPVCIIAGADLAHVGARFGRETPLSEDELPDVERADLALVESMAAVDADAVADQILRDKDARNICGFPPIYVLLRALGAAEGQRLEYGISYEEDTASCVSFAAIAFR